MFDVCVVVCIQACVGKKCDDAPSTHDVWDVASSGSTHVEPTSAQVVSQLTPGSLGSQ